MYQPMPAGRHRPVLATLAVAALAIIVSLSPVRAQDAVLVTEWSGKKVMSFSPVDGSLLNAAFITTGGIGQPVVAINSGRNTILVSDTLTSSSGIYEYDLNGAFLRKLASATGGVKGMDIYNGELYAVVGGTSVHKYDLTTGADLGTFISGLGSAADVHFRSGDILVSDRVTTSGPSLVREYSLAGALLGNLVNSPGSPTINLPYQINDAPGGHLLVGGFAAPGALYEYDASGNQVATFGGGLGRFVRGGLRLDNGQTMYTAFKSITVGSTDIMTGTSLNPYFARRVSLTTVPEPGTLSLLGVGLALLPFRRRR